MKLSRMKKFILCIVFSMIGISGCKEPGKQWKTLKTDFLFQKAMNCYYQGNYRQALAYFEKSMMITPTNEESYLYSALICDEMLNKPEKAASYYKRFLQISADPEKKELVTRWIENLNKKLAHDTGENDDSILNNHDFKSPAELATLINKNRALTEQNKKLESLNKELESQMADQQKSITGLQAELGLLHALIQTMSTKEEDTKNTVEFIDDSPEQPSEQPQPLTSPAPTPAYRKMISDETVTLSPDTTPIIDTAAGPAESQHYSVKKGDTLLSISRKFYGESKFWKLIWEKNKFQIKNIDNLQPGQIIIIPKIYKESK